MPTRVKTSYSQRPQFFALRIALSCILAYPYLALTAGAQEVQNKRGDLDGALRRAKLGEAGGRDVVVIADAGAIQAIPDLEKQFIHATDVDTKISLASGLVQLRDQDDTYWNYLLEQATSAVESDVPDLNFSESGGKMMVFPTPELQAWADSHNVSVDKAGQDARYDFPGKVFRLATTGDSRGIPLLRRALGARDLLIVYSAAKGLALIQNRDSIPLIIEAAKRAPSGYAAIVAESLVYFDDAQAQSAVDTYIPKAKATLLREARSHGMKPFGY